ncbi:restriction endonuclease subunit S [Lacticaseibacillus paracasei]|uniref:restriction endonuclease subunit S n=1 Tax=Lacticaseibacillus paracasei TaxID=1597 RepID=UPI0013E3F1DC|nr:restriction endonuclease subunit S [Lacticaseibacillus paracasei]
MSKDAKNVPALRFKGYSDAWEKRKLGEISPLRGGFAFKSSEFKDKGIPIIRISNIKSDGKVGGDFVYYHEQEVDQSYLLPQRAALLAMSGATTGKVAILHKQHEGNTTKPTGRVLFESERCLIQFYLSPRLQ